jgi:hypothetical protein
MVNARLRWLIRNPMPPNIFGMDASTWVSAGILDNGWGLQTIFVIVFTVIQAVINHMGGRAATILTDVFGYVIPAVAVIPTLGLPIYAPSIDVGRLFALSDFTGEGGGAVWPPPAGVSWFSRYLRQVSRACLMPAHAIRAAGVLSVIATLDGNAFIVLSTACAMFLYVSCVMPILAGLRAEGKTRTN